MGNAKKKICLITNWYPTKENPYQGIFFKEQAQALGDYFDFTVVHYKENRSLPALLYVIRKLQGKTVSVVKSHEEKNTTEYDVKVSFPRYTIYTDKLGVLYDKFVKHTSMEGVSVYVSKAHQKRKKKALTEIFQKHFADKVDVLYCVDAQQESSTLQYVSEALGKPYVVSEHAPFLYPGKGLKLRVAML